MRDGCAAALKLGRRLCLAGLAVCLGAIQAAAEDAVKRPVARPADFQKETASTEVRYVATWILHSADNAGLPFVIVDKVQAKVFLFDAQGGLLGAAPALLGQALGDHTVSGIGTRPLSDILPTERTTPAGRFVASLDRNLRGAEILWVDYESGVSLHAVVAGTLKERRAARLASVTPLDNRISYGCINVPLKFYQNVVSRAFAGTSGIVYVLPEVRSLQEVFASYPLKDGAQVQAAPQAR